MVHIVGSEYSVRRAFPFQFRRLLCFVRNLVRNQRRIGLLSHQYIPKQPETSARPTSFGNAFVTAAEAQTSSTGGSWWSVLDSTCSTSWCIIKKKKGWVFYLGCNIWRSSKRFPPWFWSIFRLHLDVYSVQSVQSMEVQWFIVRVRKSWSTKLVVPIFHSIARGTHSQSEGACSYQAHDVCVAEYACLAVKDIW